VFHATLPCMKHFATLLIVPCLLFISKAQAQEHAPTMDVCRADVALWDNSEEQTDYLNQETKHINDGVRNANPIAKLTVREVFLRLSEMADCASVDEAKANSYRETVRFYSSVVADRYRSFIERHDLMRKFMAEDKAGAR
jgi:hypothetical protein